MTPPARRSFLARVGTFVRHKLAAGFVALFPIAVTVWVALWLLQFLDGLIGKYLAEHVPIPGSGIIALFLLMLLTGTVVSSLLGRRLFHLYERVLQRVPLANAVYKGSKQLMEAFSHGGSGSFQRVVLVEYPRKGLYGIGFVTREAVGEVQAATPEQVSCVFLPTTPNPTSGFLLLVPNDQIIPLSMSIEDGIKVIISGGLMAPDLSPRPVASMPALPAPVTPRDGSGGG